MDSGLIALAGLAVLLTVTPGPDTVLVVRNVLRGGVRGGIATSFGSATGLLVHLAASTLGLSAVMLHSAEAFHMVRIAGACYLIWLGARALFAAMQGQLPELSVEASTTARGRAWREGFLTNVLNPKVAVFYLAVLPQAAVPAGGEATVADALTRSLLFGVLHIVIGIVWFSFLSCSLHRVRGTLLRPLVRRLLDGGVGALMVAFGLRLALDRSN